jgi:hypothetical protein
MLQASLALTVQGSNAKLVLILERRGSDLSFHAKKFWCPQSWGHPEVIQTFFRAKNRKKNPFSWPQMTFKLTSDDFELNFLSKILIKIFKCFNKTIFLKISKKKYSLSSRLNDLWVTPGLRASKFLCIKRKTRPSSFQNQDQFCIWPLDRES